MQKSGDDGVRHEVHRVHGLRSQSWAVVPSFPSNAKLSPYPLERSPVFGRSSICLIGLSGPPKTGIVYFCGYVADIFYDSGFRYPSIDLPIFYVKPGQLLAMTNISVIIRHRKSPRPTSRAEGPIQIYTEMIFRLGPSLWPQKFFEI